LKSRYEPQFKALKNKANGKCEHTELPDRSVAAHVTVVLPRINCEPEVGEHVTVGEPALSVATGL
jgi:hypothetical protein